MPSKTAWLGTLLVLTVACVERLELGSECSDVPEACRDQPGREAAASSTETESEREATSAVNTDRDDDSHAGSARPDAPRAARMAGPIEDYVENGEFELTRGLGGPLGLELETSSSIALGENFIAPWSVCRTGFSGVQSSYAVRGDADSAEVLPREGEAFVEAAIGVEDFSGLKQLLKQPLERAARYAFRVDLRASAGADVALEFWSSAIPCLPTLRLARTAVVGDTWRSVCVVLEPPLETHELIIKPVGKLGTRAFFDNLRSAPDCL